MCIHLFGEVGVVGARLDLVAEVPGLQQAEEAPCGEEEFGIFESYVPILRTMLRHA